MILADSKRLTFNLIGIGIVILWLVMMGLLFKKENFIGPKGEINYEKSDISIDAAEREWKEIFLKDKKVGYSVSIINPFEDGYFIQEEILLKLNLMGVERSMYSTTQSMLNKDFQLESFHFRMSSGVVRFIISGKVEGNYLNLTTGTGKSRTTRSIALSEVPMMGAGLGYFFKNKKIKVGDRFEFPMFDPSTMAQQTAVVKVTAKEKISINNIQYDAFRLDSNIWGSQMTFWVDEEGATLKEEGFMGLSTVRSSAANAPHNFDVQDGEDFYETVAVSIDRALPNPDSLRYLEVRLKGLEDMPRLTEGMKGGRQEYDEGIMKITKEQLTSFIQGSIFPRNEYPPGIKGYLEPEYNIESDKREIIEIAQEITGDAKSPVSKARKLLYWVYDNLEKKPVVSIPSALEVLRTRIGDCNEHATLLTALLRATGIPARICVGLVYNRDRFYYHAWNEAFIGDGWITMDATLNQIPADVSHIRFMHGNLERQVEITGLIGRLEMELMTYRK